MIILLCCTLIHQLEGPWGEGDDGQVFYDGLATSIISLELDYDENPEPGII